MLWEHDVPRKTDQSNTMIAIVECRFVVEGERVERWEKTRELEEICQHAAKLLWWIKGAVD